MADKASGSNSGTCLAAPPSLNRADLAFHLNLARTRKSPKTLSAGGGDSATPLAAAVGKSWVGWFYSHSQELPETVLAQHGGKLPGDERGDAMALWLGGRQAHPTL